MALVAANVANSGTPGYTEKTQSVEAAHRRPDRHRRRCRERQPPAQHLRPEPAAHREFRRLLCGLVQPDLPAAPAGLWRSVIRPRLAAVDLLEFHRRPASLHPTPRIIRPSRRHHGRDRARQSAQQPHAPRFRPCARAASRALATRSPAPTNLLQNIAGINTAGRRLAERHRDDRIRCSISATRTSTSLPI